MNVSARLLWRLAVPAAVCLLTHRPLVHVHAAAPSASRPVTVRAALQAAGSRMNSSVRAQLAGKPSPWLVKAHDVGAPTDFHKDIPWHLLDKEKDARFDLPKAGKFGVFNTNSDINFVLEIVDQNGLEAQRAYTDHLVNLAVQQLTFEGGRGDVLFMPVASDTLLCVVSLENSSPSPLTLQLRAACTKQPDSPLPFERYGYGIHSITGRRIAAESVPREQALMGAFEEWDQTRDNVIGTLICTLMSGDPPSSHTLEMVSDPVRNERVARQRFEFAVKLAPASEKTFIFALNLHRFGPRAIISNDILLYPAQTRGEAVRHSLEAARMGLAADWPGLVRESFRWYERMPIIELPVEHWARDTYCALELPRGNTWSAQDLLGQPWYTFCRVHGHNPYGWWSYGMHGHEHLSTFTMNLTEPALSQNWLRGHFQVQRPDGFIRYGVNLTKKNVHEGLATAPLLMWEAWNAYLWSGDRAFLEEAYRAGAKYLAWWRSEARTRRSEGWEGARAEHRRDAGATPLLPLAHWKDYIETVRDDRDLATWVATGKAEHQEALDLNCYLLNEERTLAAIARELGKADEADRWEEDAQRRAAFMREKLWHDEDKVFYGRDLVEDRWARVMDISTFLPLWSGLATPGQARHIVARLHDPESFATDFPIATLAVKHMPQKKRGYYHWRGSNWVEMTWLAILGLKRYGYHDEAARIAEINCRMVYDTLEKTGHFREFYSSLTGEPSDLTDYIWTCLPAAMVVDIFFGIRPTAEGLQLDPVLPVGWNRIAISDLHMRDRRVSLSVRRGQVDRTHVTLNGRELDTRGARGAQITWDSLPQESRIEIIQPSELR